MDHKVNAHIYREWRVSQASSGPASQGLFQNETSVGIRAVRRVQSRPRALQGPGSTASLESTQPPPSTAGKMLPTPPGGPFSWHSSQKDERAEDAKDPKLKSTTAVRDVEGPRRNGWKRQKRLLLAELEAGRSEAEDFHFLKGFSSTVHKYGFNKDQGLAAAQIHQRFLFPRDQDRTIQPIQHVARFKSKSLSCQ